MLLRDGGTAHISEFGTAAARYGERKDYGNERIFAEKPE